MGSAVLQGVITSLTEHPYVLKITILIYYQMTDYSFFLAILFPHLTSCIITAINSHSAWLY